MVVEHFFDSRDAMQASLVAEIVFLLEQALAEHGQALLLVSGGSSPQPIYQALSAQPLDWAKITVALVDERWVDLNHPASNEAFIRQQLLRGPAAKARLVAMKTPASSAESGLAECEARYQQLCERADICLLGMGSDGHTASLFPYAHGLEAGLNPENPHRCVAISAQRSEVTGDHTERLSLTLNYIQRSKKQLLLITGQVKLDCYRQALVCSELQLMPISALLNSDSAHTEVYWAP